MDRIDSSREIDSTDLDLNEILPHHRQRSARTDASMRDGDSGHGNPGENPEDELSSDNDIGDSEDAETIHPDPLEQFPDRHGADGRDLEEAESAEETPTDLEMPAFDSDLAPVEAPAVVFFNEYEGMKIPEIVARAELLDDTALRELVVWETAGRNRKTLIAKLNRLLQTRSA